MAEQNSDGAAKPPKKKKRGGPGKPFTKDDPRINRRGRPQSFARAIRDLCDDDPLELAKIAMGIAKGELSFEVVKPFKVKAGPNAPDRIINHKLLEIPNHDQRLDALVFLRDTGWGKPAQKIELSQTEQDADAFEKLPPKEQARLLREAAEKLELDEDAP